MGPSPFELYGRALIEGGVKLLFRCTACKSPLTLILRDDDPLDGKFPVACECGVEVNLYFGSPKVGQALVKSLKNLREPEDAYHRCNSPLLN
jgi:hypothetical protein